jgi:transcriptional regulator NrdR family protein
MKCLKCGKARWRVVNTRNPDQVKRSGFNADLYSTATGAVGWYTYDWVVRKRNCEVCGFTKITIEVTSDDLLEMLRLAASGEYEKP